MFEKWFILKKSIDAKTKMVKKDYSEELIRCKDCKYYGRADRRRFYRGEDCINGHISTIVPEKDFCSRAERKDNG